MEPSLDIAFIAAAFSATAFQVAMLVAFSMVIAVIVTYSAYAERRGARHKVWVAVGLVTCICLSVATVYFWDRPSPIVSIIFLAITIPIGNLMAVGILMALTIYWKRTGQIYERNKVESYLGPVDQKPVDVQSDNKPILLPTPTKKLKHD